LRIRKVGNIWFGPSAMMPAVLILIVSYYWTRAGVGFLLG
jgi:hypothetical protein